MLISRTKTSSKGQGFTKLLQQPMRFASDFKSKKVNLKGSIGGLMDDLHKEEIEVCWLEAMLRKAKVKNSSWIMHPRNSVAILWVEVDVGGRVAILWVEVDEFYAVYSFSIRFHDQYHIGQPVHVLNFEYKSSNSELVYFLVMASRL